ncbi:MAG: hypothetical protein ACREC0_10250 [Methylocella sp.]
MSVSNSFKKSITISVSVKGGISEVSDTVGGSFTYAKSTTNTQGLDIKKSTTSKIQDAGPSSDGIDHDHDLIYLWLNPKIDLAVTRSSVAWALNGSDEAVIQYVYVGELKDPSKMPPGVSQLDRDEFRLKCTRHARGISGIRLV